MEMILSIGLTILLHSFALLIGRGSEYLNGIAWLVSRQDPRRPGCGSRFLIEG